MENIKRYVSKMKIPYPVAYDENNGLSSAYGLPYGAGAVFISKEGVVTGRFRSGFNEADFKKELTKALQ